MENKKGQIEGIDWLLGEKTINLLMAILVSVLLIVLVVSLLNFASERQLIGKAEKELNNMNSKFKLFNANSKPFPYPVLSAPEWYLYSTSNGYNLCRSVFCLCLCQFPTCNDDLQSCIPTDKFVLLKLKGEATTGVQLGSPPTDVSVGYIAEKVFPVSYREPEVKGGKMVFYPTMFLKYDELQKKWRWTRDLDEENLDKEVWRDLSDTSVLNKDIPSEKDSIDLLIKIRDNIDAYNGNNLKEALADFFTKSKISISDGVYYVDVTKVNEKTSEAEYVPPMVN